MTVWDAFFINDELDLLEYRLSELDAHVDRFIIVEGTRTFTGTAKPLNFELNRDRFARWSERIHHVVADVPAESQSPWHREHAQRQVLGRTLQEVSSSDDLIMIGDVDETPRRELVPWLAAEMEDVVLLQQRHALWFANTFMTRPWNLGTVVCRPQHLDHTFVRRRLGDSEVRPDRAPVVTVRRGGWHLSSLGGPERVRAKVEAYSHQEHNVPSVIEPSHLERVIRYGIWMDGRGLLRYVDPADLEPALKRLAQRHPALVAEGPPGRWIARHAYAAFTWLRVNGGLPDRISRAFDHHEGWLVLGPATPVLLMIQFALTLRRTFVKQDDGRPLGPIVNPPRAAE